VKGEGQAQTHKRPNWGLLAAILLFHAAAFYGLAKALAPVFTQSVERSVADSAMVSVWVAEPPPPPDAPPDPDEGAQGSPGKRAIARAETAPKTAIKNPEAKSAPRASSTGTANNSGASASGSGTGSAGEGEGTGSGRGGSGTGNGREEPTPDQSRGPSVRSGAVTARDFPTPEGWRSTRYGKKIEVIFTVTTSGQARNCSVAVNQVDSEAANRACGLVARKITFSPALNRDGQPIEARYGYRITFRER